VPERDLLDPLPPTNKHFAAIERMKLVDIQFKGNASPLTKLLGNINRHLDKLRA